MYACFKGRVCDFNLIHFCPIQLIAPHGPLAVCVVKNPTVLAL